ncbi:MAG: sensor histidine kinase [Lachnospiraceae bacterium]
MSVIAGLFYFDSSFLKADTAIYLTLFAIILISIVAFATLYKVARNSKELMDTNLKIQQMEMEQKLAQNLTDIVGNLRSLRHDMNNHLGILQNLLEIGAYEETSDYLRSISEDLKIANQYVFTENQMLSVLLNTKISHATALRIPIDTDILVNEIPLEDKDLCAIIGNLLDNAIEAAEKAEQPSISFSMQREEDCLIIRCENSFSETPVFENGKLITSKENKTLHGIGTQNILSTAKRYDGSAEFSFDTLFHACVTIPYS